MATDKLQIVLDAVWRGKSKLQQAHRDIDNLENQTKETVTTFDKFAGAAAGVTLAVGAIAGASALAFKALERGAELELLRSRFDNLTESIHTTSDALLTDLKESSQGMVSQAELIAGANELMQGKLARSHDEVVRLSTVATQLGWDMGVLAQTINNQSVLRLDNLGLAAEDVVPKFRELKDAGLDLKDAFTQALIEAGEAQLELVGSEADTTSGKIKQLQAAVDDVKNSFFEAFTETAVEGLEATSEGVVGLQSDFSALASYIGTTLSHAMVTAGFAFSNLINQISSGIQGVIGGAQNLWNFTWGYPAVSQSDYEQAYGASYADFGKASSVPQTTNQVEALNNALTRLGTEYQPVNDINEKLGIIPNKLAQIGTEYKSVSDAGEKLLRVHQMEAIAAEEAAEEADNLAGSYGGLRGEITTLAEEMANLAAQTGDFFAQARRMDDFNPFESLFEAADKYGANALQLSNIGVAGGLFDESQAQEYLRRTALMQRAESLAQLLASGRIDEQQAVDMLGGLEGQFEEGELLAQDFFAGLNEEEVNPDLLLNTDPAMIEYDLLVQYVENNPPVAVVRFVTEADADEIRRPPGTGETQ